MPQFSALKFLEKLSFPPTSVLSGKFSESFDLTTEEIASFQRPQTACPKCGHLQPQSVLCGECLKSPPSFARTQFAYQYAGGLKNLILEFKFKPQRSHGRLLAEISAEQFEASGVQALIPVPLHAKRFRERGFNQAQRLAYYWGKYHKIPSLKNAVVRHRETESQAQLNRAQRLKNLRSAFAVNGDALKGLQRIALVDDVMTTGTTLRTLAQVIKKQYPDLKIEVWVLARAQE